METRIYKTKITGELIKRDFVRGRISGVMDVICKDDPMERRSYAIGTTTKKDVITNEEYVISVTYTTKTDPERYKKQGLFLLLLIALN